MITSVLHVSSGMNEDGGGSAHLGRLIGASLRRHCARHRLAFHGLHLPPLDGSVATDGYAAFGGLTTRLPAGPVSLRIACLSFSRRQTALCFDQPLIADWLETTSSGSARAGSVLSCGGCLCFC